MSGMRRACPPGSSHRDLRVESAIILIDGSGESNKKAEPDNLRGGDATRFAGNVALVTGAGSGIGKATVDQLLAGGARVVAVDVAEGTLQTALVDWQANGSQVTSVVANVMDEADVERMIETTYAPYGRLDILSNNAGIMDMMTPAAVISTEL
jgi:3-oxoacyl-ACP reductase-like protein